MKISEITCHICGRNASEVRGWLERISPKGEPMVMECRPACYPLMTEAQAVLGAISGDPRGEQA